jgi:hypothetical protein
MTTRTEWTGTASELLGALAELAGERIAKAKTWPDSPRALAGRLRRAATFLRKIGIDIVFEREGRARTRMIRITTTGKPASPETGGVQASASSAPPVDRPKVSSGNGFASPGLRTVGNVADGSTGGNGLTVHANPPIPNAEADADGADGRHPRQSALENTGWRARL